MNAAAPRNVGKTKGIGSSNFQTLHPYISVRLVNQASNVPITAAEAETANAKETDRQRGESILSVPIRLIGSESSVRLRQIR